MNFSKVSYVLCVVSVCLVTTAYGQINVASPNANVSATVSVDGSGRLTYSVNRGSTTVIESSPLGIITGGLESGVSDGVDLGSGVTLGTPSTSTVNTSYSYMGSQSSVADHYTLTTIPVTHTASGKTYNLEMRAYDDGVAYRYNVPNSGEIAVLGEASSWTLPSNADVWYHTNTYNYEGTYRKGTTGSLDAGLDIGGPMTFKLADGTYGAIAEAAPYNYSGMTLQTTDSRTVKATFLDGQFREDSADKIDQYYNTDHTYLPDDRWRISGDVVSPWRVTVAAADLNGLSQAKVIQNCNPRPDSSVDYSFVQPGKSVWSWWAKDSLAPGSRSATEIYNTEKRYIDRAAELGFQFTLLDDGHSTLDDYTAPDGKDMVTSLIDYANSKGIGTWLWYSWSSTDEGIANGECWPWGNSNTRENFFQEMVDRGVVGVKIDFMDREAMASLTWYEETMKAAEQYGIMVNFHGANKSAGEQVRFPGQMTREGVQGLEWYRSGQDRSLTHETSLPFTRMLGEAMDYTPVTLDPNKIGNTSFAYQVASAVVYVSPVTHFADDPDNYVGNEATDIIAAMPTVWDESLVLDGSEIGETAAFARRSGNTWFVGIMNGDSAKTGAGAFDLNLAFLEEGLWDAIFLSDDLNNAAAFNRSEWTDLTAADGFLIDLRSGGGFVAEFTQTAVPEPATLSALALGGLGLLRRRRKNRK